MNDLGIHRHDSTTQNRDWRSLVRVKKIGSTRAVALVSVAKKTMMVAFLVIIIVLFEQNLSPDRNKTNFNIFIKKNICFIYRVLGRIVDI